MVKSLMVVKGYQTATGQDPTNLMMRILGRFIMHPEKVQCTVDLLIFIRHIGFFPCTFLLTRSKIKWGWFYEY